MNARNLLILAVLAFIPPVSALELGPIQVKSYLNQPLFAQLQVEDIDALELADIQFSLAGHGQYQNLKMSRPTYLDPLTFKLDANGDRRFTLSITSKKRVVEPILNLLLQVDEKDGKLIRHYTLLLDPQGARNQSSVPETESVIQSHPHTAARLPTETRSAETAEEKSKTIRIGNDSISMYAQNSPHHPAFSVYQIMRAYYLSNPDAFERGNINKLISGVLLNVPADEEIAEVPRQKAVNFVYSVSRDNPTSKQSSLPVASAESDQQQAISANLKTTQAPTSSIEQKVLASDQPSSNANEDISAWRGVSEEFDQLTVMVARQNNAVAIQNSALQTLSDDMEKHQQQITRLEVSVDSLKTLVQGESNPVQEQFFQQQQTIAEQDQTINNQTKTIEAINEQLTHQQDEIGRLNQQLELAQFSVGSSNAGADPEPFPQPEPNEASEVGIAPPKIVTHVPAQTSDLVQNAYLFALILALGLFGWREWTWRRRLAQPSVKAPMAPAPNKQSRKSTYSPSKNQETIENLELKPIENKRKIEPEMKTQEVVVTDKSSLRLESTTMDDVKVEIDVLLAYEQYDEAMGLIVSARQRFNDQAWLDMKELEILALTRQCEVFLSRFDDKMDSLKKQHPLDWAKIEKMRERLCETFNVSAIR